MTLETHNMFKRKICGLTQLKNSTTKRCLTKRNSSLRTALSRSYYYLLNNFFFLPIYLSVPTIWHFYLIL